MAHPAHVKAQALAMLMTGEGVVYTAKTLNLPKQTISRWKPQADALFREIVRGSPALQKVAAQIRAVLPGLSRTNGTKKRRVRRVGNV
jgi:hypothetical protein